MGSSTTTNLVLGEEFETDVSFDLNGRFAGIVDQGKVEQFIERYNIDIVQLPTLSMSLTSGGTGSALYEKQDEPCPKFLDYIGL